MRVYILMSGLAVVAMGVVAQRLLERAAAMGFLLESLTLGGGMILCALFAIKMRWHGIVGAGVLGLLGAARGAANIPDWIRMMAGDRSRGAAPALELGVAMISLLVLLRVLRMLRRERAKHSQTLRLLPTRAQR